MKRGRKFYIGAILLALIVALGITTQAVLGKVVAQASKAADNMPTFEVEPAWPKMPEKWVISDVSGLAVDGRDHIWVLNRANLMTNDELLGATNPPQAECCVRNPFVMEFDMAGNYIRAGAGRGPGMSGPKTCMGSPSITKATSGSLATDRSAPVAPGGPVRTITTF